MKRVCTTCGKTFTDRRYVYSHTKHTGHLVEKVQMGRPPRVHPKPIQKPPKPLFKASKALPLELTEDPTEATETLGRIGPATPQHIRRRLDHENELEYTTGVRYDKPCEWVDFYLEPTPDYAAKKFLLQSLPPWTSGK